MRNKNKANVLVYIFVLLAISTFIIGRVQVSNNKNSLRNLRSSGYWATNFIHIDGNWSDTAITYEWCSGNGSWNNPYMIKDVIINASSSPTGQGIFINNSKNHYFIIRNCTISEADNGIILKNTNNGIIINNTCSQNNRGIQLNTNCTSNSIINNTANYNVYSGIVLDLICNDNFVSGNIAYSNGDHGTYLVNYSNENLISENKVNSNGAQGIYLENDCDYNTISENSAYNNDFGILLLNTCNNNTILYNYASNNLDSGIYIRGLYDTIMGNTANDNGDSGIEARGGGYTTILENTAKRNVRAGICLRTMYSDVLGNTATNNIQAGIYLDMGNGYTTISGNAVNNNSYGIDSRGYNRDNNITENTFHHNVQYGVMTEPYDDDNLFYLNEFIGNGHNAIDFGDNEWDNGTIGNYWDDYDGVDADDNGIGDTPYTLHAESDNYPIWDDGLHILTIDSPEQEDFFGVPAPHFNLSINFPILDTLWYTLDNGATNHTFIGSKGVINQTAWDAYDDGATPIRFYVNNTAGNFYSTEVIILKETIAPKITIHSPLVNSIFGHLAPAYDISIEEVNFKSSWYTIDGGITNFTIANPVGIINQESWSASPNGHVTIRFYALDLAGNLGFRDTVVIKDAPEKLIDVEIVDQSFSTEEFGITLFACNENDQPIEFATIQLWWNGVDVSVDVINRGNGFYFVSLEPITVTPGEAPILLNMIILAEGYHNKYFETYIAVDPETLQKGAGNPSEEFPIIVAIPSIVGIIGLASISMILLLRRKRTREGI